VTDPPHDWAPFALLLIDVQRDFWTDQMAAHFPDFPANIARLLDFCRSQGIEIVHLRVSYKPDMSDWMVRYKLRGQIPCVEGTPGIETLPCAVERPGETVLIKRTFDGFYNPELLAHLRRKGVRFVLTAGLVTSTCVLLTTASAAQNGFLAAMIDDCCADEPTAHAQTLNEYGFMFERTSLDRLSDRRVEWLSALGKLDELERCRFYMADAT
jgi:nicotinamidase-related amidase